MKLLCWNVNGFRAVIQKGFYDWLEQCNADIIGLQETKLQQTHEQDYTTLPAGYTPVWLSSTVKKGYSGVACFYKNAPLSISYDLPNERYKGEGRLIQLEYPDFYYFNIYFPNGGMGPERLEYKLGFYDAFLEYAESLRKTKPIVVCGDFNTAHKEIDLKNPKQNSEISGFLPIERAWVDTFINHGYVDTYRMFDQSEEKYTWWTYRFGARKRNAGWRIDYFFVSEELKNNVKHAWIDADVMGSDHCPIGLEIDFS